MTATKRVCVAVIAIAALTLIVVNSHMTVEERVNQYSWRTDGATLRVEDTPPKTIAGMPGPVSFRYEDYRKLVIRKGTQTWTHKSYRDSAFWSRRHKCAFFIDAEEVGSQTTTTLYRWTSEQGFEVVSIFKGWYFSMSLSADEESICLVGDEEIAVFNLSKNSVDVFPFSRQQLQVWNIAPKRFMTVNTEGGPDSAITGPTISIYDAETRQSTPTGLIGIFRSPILFQGKFYAFQHTGTKWQIAQLNSSFTEVEKVIPIPKGLFTADPPHVWK